MTDFALAALIVSAVVAVIDWGAVATGARRLEYLAKPATTAMLIVVAIALDPADATQRAWFVAALVASLAGDVALMLPTDETSSGAGHRAPTAPPITFIVGLLSFLLAHVAYVIGFLVVGVSVVGVTIGSIVVVVAGASIGRVIVQAGRRVGGPPLAMALAGYLVVISAMLVAAFGSGLVLAALGATWFFASDALIGWDRFVRTFPGARAIIMVTYHLGQAGLVLSLLG